MQVELEITLFSKQEHSNVIALIQCVIFVVLLQHTDIDKIKF